MNKTTASAIAGTVLSTVVAVTSIFIALASNAHAEPGSCSVNIPGCEGYGECHPVATGKVDCFPENESCSKPGNTFPWCAPTTTQGARRQQAGEAAQAYRPGDERGQSGWVAG